MPDVSDEDRKAAEAKADRVNFQTVTAYHCGYQAGRLAGLEEAAVALEADAKLCDCSAYEENECACGAWCEWKTITSARAVEIVRAAKGEDNG